MKKTNLYLFISVAVMCLSGCCKHESSYLPKNGDLAFVLSDNSDFSNAITDATGSGAHDFVHVAIVNVEQDSVYVIEATAKHGVSKRGFSQFISEIKGGKESAGVVIKRVKVDFNTNAAVERAKGFIGEPYNWSFLRNSGGKYCSELVYESYLTESGEHLFTARPMNFLDNDGNLPEFWARLFNRLGIEVPQGEPGTNPNDMSKEPCLTEVFRYFTSIVTSDCSTDEYILSVAPYVDVLCE